MRTRLATVSLVALLIAACGGESVNDPAFIEARITPQRSWYQAGTTITLTGVVTDVFGQVLEGEEVIWEVDRPSWVSPGEPTADPGQATYVLNLRGRVNFTGCVARRPILCTYISALVDDGSPILELIEPAPGAEIDAPEGVRVRGAVTDGGNLRVFVNGNPAELDETGRFDYTIPARFGINPISVVASDGITPVAQAELDVLWAPAFTPALDGDGRPFFSLQDGISLWLGQRFFDDGNPFDPEARPVVTEDLASLLELVLTRLDLVSAIPDPVLDEDFGTLRIPSAELGAPRAELEVREGGIDMFLRIGAFEAQTEGSLELPIDGADETFDLDGRIVASIAAFASISVSKADADSEVEVELDQLVVAIESVEGTFADAEVTALFRLAEGLLRSVLEDQFREVVQGVLADTVPALLRDVLTGIDGALVGQEFTLDTDLFPPVTIQIDGRMSRLATAYRTALFANLRTEVGTTSVSVHPGSRGIARLNPAAMSPGFFREGSVQAGVRLGLLNGLLHSLWSSGLLSVDIAEILPDSVAGVVTDARLDGRLPPVIRPAQIGEFADLILALGQLELDVTFMGLSARYGIRIEVDIDLEVHDNTVEIVLGEEPTIVVWTIVAPESERILNAELVHQLLTDEVWPQLQESLGEGLALELPIPALGDLGGLAPDLRDLQLSLEMGDRLYPRGDLLVLDARLVGRLPD